MKKGLFVALLCCILCFGVAQAEEKTIENISTVVGSHCHDGFVPFGAVSFGGDVVVADSANHRLSVVDKTTARVTKTIGSYGKGNNQFVFPSDVAVLDKNLLVSDSGNKRIGVLSPTYEMIDTIGLKDEPVAITAAGSKIYVLYGKSVEVFDGASRKSELVIPLNKPAFDLGVVGEKLLLLGKETHLYSMADGSYERRSELDGAISVDGDGGRLFVLFRESFRVLDASMKQIGGRDLAEKLALGAIHGFGDRVLVSDTDGGKVFEFKDASAVGSYGRGHARPQVRQVTAGGKLAAVGTPRGIELFRKGEHISGLELEGVVDIQLHGGQLFVLTRHTVLEYEITQGDKVTLRRNQVLGANKEYSFRAMAIMGNDIYITEETGGKVLRTTKDFKALTTFAGQLNKPSAITVGGGNIYVGDAGGITIFNQLGQTLAHVDDKYPALAYYGDTLFALGKDKITRYSPTLEAKEPLENPGYFIELCDINSADNGIIIGDISRREVMGYTNEGLMVTNDNITVEGNPFTGTMAQGKTLTISLTGVGMANPMPKIGDVRYVPDGAYVDTKVPFRNEGNLFVSTINLQNVGNYTLKVAYKKQAFISGGWQEVKGADSNPTYELPIGVIAESAVNQERQARQEKQAKIITDWLLKLFTG